MSHPPAHCPRTAHPQCDCGQAARCLCPHGSSSAARGVYWSCCCTLPGAALVPEAEVTLRPFREELFLSARGALTYASPWRHSPGAGPRDSRTLSPLT